MSHMQEGEASTRTREEHAQEIRIDGLPVNASVAVGAAAATLAGERRGIGLGDAFAEPLEFSNLR